VADVTPIKTNIVATHELRAQIIVTVATDTTRSISLQADLCKI